MLATAFQNGGRSWVRPTIETLILAYALLGHDRVEKSNNIFLHPNQFGAKLLGQGSFIKLNGKLLGDLPEAISKTCCGHRFSKIYRVLLQLITQWRLKKPNSSKTLYGSPYY